MTFPEAKPNNMAVSQNRSFFESFYAVSAPPEPQRKPLVLFPRVRQLIDKTQERAVALSRESRSFVKLVPLRRKSFSVGDDKEFCSQKLLNSHYARICRSKSVPRSRTTSTTYTDLERLERGSRTVMAGQSQAFWLLSSLVAQLQRDGYEPSDPVLFDENITSLSATLAVQTSLTASMAEFLTMKRRESYLSHASFTVDETLKKELLVTPVRHSSI